MSELNNGFLKAIREGARVILLLFFCLVFSATIIPQSACATALRQPPTTIAGTITSAGTTQPIPKAKVEIFLTGSLVGTTYTNSLGYYWFSRTMSGQTIIKVSKLNYRSAQVNTYLSQGKTYTFNFSLTPDSTDKIPPTGSIVVKQYSPYTDSTAVILRLDAQDNPGGIGLSKMQFSNDNLTWSTSENYRHIKAWKLSAGDGTKTVYVRYVDLAGNWSAVYSATIILDTAAPTGTFSINNGSQYTNSSSVTLNLSATDSGSGMGSGAKMRFSNDNLHWSVPENYVTTKTWTLKQGGETKTIYVKYRDVAGNWSAGYSNTISLDKTPPQIKITSPQDNETIYP